MLGEQPFCFSEPEVIDVASKGGVKVLIQNVRELVVLDSQSCAERLQVDIRIAVPAVDFHRTLQPDENRRDVDAADSGFPT